MFLQSGLGILVDRLLPQKLELENIKSVCCGNNFTIGMISSNEIYIWGENGMRKLGLGLSDFIICMPTKLNLSNIKSVSCGAEHIIALTNNNTIYVWGSNTKGQLGIGYGDTQYLFGKKYTGGDKYVFEMKPHELDIKNIESATCGTYHTIIVTKNDEIYVCGYNVRGQLGLGDKRNRDTFHKLDIGYI